MTDATKVADKLRQWGTVFAVVGWLLFIAAVLVFMNSRDSDGFFSGNLWLVLIAAANLAAMQFWRTICEALAILLERQPSSGAAVPND